MIIKEKKYNINQCECGYIKEENMPCPICYGDLYFDPSGKIYNFKKIEKKIKMQKKNNIKIKNIVEGLP